MEIRYLLLIVFSVVLTGLLAQEKKNWTIMHYAVGSNSSEIDLLSDVSEMQRGKLSEDYNLLLLIDRVAGYSEDSTTLDGNFTDTRLYQIGYNSYKRVDGNEYLPGLSDTQSYEANMADASLLKKYIQYCKNYYPANHYLLVLRSHGNGVAMCPTSANGVRDRLYPAELTDILTDEESVDILGLDVCSMAGLENMYQWRPENQSFSADYVIASAPLSGAWAYDRILERLTEYPSEGVQFGTNFFEGGKETNLDPNRMSPLAFSNLIFEEIYDNQRWASWGLFDNSKVQALKNKIDEASRSLAKEDKDSILEIITTTLGYYHNVSEDLELAQLTFPYLDAHHFWHQVSTQSSFSNETREKAKSIGDLLNAFVVHSYYGVGYLPETQDFINDVSGAYQIIPQGDKLFSQTGNTFWTHCGWFSPHDKSSQPDAYGSYEWCIDGAVSGNNQVENFFELMDYLFDDVNDDKGGVNEYQW